MNTPLNEDLTRALEVVKRGGVILYPTETVWGIGCDATRADAIERIYRLKQRSDAKALICLIDSAERLENWVSGVPEVAYQLIEAAVEPLTIVYDGAYVPPLAANLPAADGSLAIRVTSDPFCRKLCRALRRPLVSTSANISGHSTPQSFSQISSELLGAVDYVCTGGRQTPKEPRKPSGIIKLSPSGIVKIIR